MPKGKHGCFVCGQPTAGLLQLWERVYYYAPMKKKDKDKKPVKKQRTGRSISVSLCQQHLDEAYTDARQTFPHRDLQESSS